MSPPQKIVDLRLPLPWLITGAISFTMFMILLGWNASTQSSKLDQLIQANTKLEKRLDDRDIRLDALRDALFAVQRNNDMNSLKISAIEARLGSGLK